MKQWSCPKKIEARQETILSLPKPENQYWTMSGLCTYAGCELDQLLRSKFIRSDQWHGVDISKDIHDANCDCHPSLAWHHGDFFQIMSQYSKFNPSIVNADLLQTIDTASDYISRLLYLLTPFKCTLVANIIMEHRNRYKTTVEHVLEKLRGCQQFRYASRRGWTLPNRCYMYAGTGARSKTVMGTFIFQHLTTCISVI